MLNPLDLVVIGVVLTLIDHMRHGLNPAPERRKCVSLGEEPAACQWLQAGRLDCSLKKKLRTASS